MQRKRTNKVYSPEFKIMVVENMRNNHLGYSEAVIKFKISKVAANGKNTLKNWERIYLEEGVAGLMKEHRGRASKLDGVKKGRPPKLEKQVEEDLIAENQRLRMEVDYLKKLHALALSQIESENGTKHK